MIETEIRTRIAEALAGRMDQRSFVDELSTAWASMGAALGRLIHAIEGAERSIQANHSAIEKSHEFHRAIDALLHGTDHGGAPQVDALRARVESAGRQVDAACARVRRETVNIGVIGGTKVGKSTLLRTVTDLPESVIPTTRYNPTTAAASRIYHTDGEARAVLHLHTWESFRDEYLAPLHELAGLGPVPPDADGFRHFRYALPGSQQAGSTEADDYLRKLHAAQRSFGSYASLLHGADRTISVDFADLRPYVAYPDAERGDPVENQPFHAVRNVRVDQKFPELAAAKLGLIDLPGAGEAGLDIDRQFLQQVKNEIDLLLMVKRGDRKSATYLTEDSYTRKLADTARGGVPLEDYYMVVVNRDAENDPSGDYFANTVKVVSETSSERNITVLKADVIDRESVFVNLVRPVLNHLATRLAEMDRAAVREALTLATTVAGEVAGYANDVLSRTRDLSLLLPDQEDEFRNLAERLRDDLAEDLIALVDRYDDSLANGQADTALTDAISEAVKEARSWVRGGLGQGDRTTWTTKIKGRYVAGPLKAKQHEYYNAKTKVSEIFSQIDVSLDQSVQQLWEEIAEVLRGRLTADLVPATPAALEALRETANDRRALILRDALRRLCQLKVDYGSVVLRVTQPVIRQIHWDWAPPAHAMPAPPVPATPTPIPAQPPRPTPATGGWVRQPDGSMQRATPVTVRVPPPHSQPLPSQPPPSQPPPPAKDGSGTASANRGVESLYDELTTAVENCISALETALRDEGRVMSRTLAAAADRFFDSVIRTNHTERDYEYLCRPNRRSIWPDRFDGGAARLDADLSRVQEQATAVLGVTDVVSRLSAGLRLRSISEP